MTKAQYAMSARMLELAADEFSNHSCNDYELPNTSENLEFVRGMIAASDYPEDKPNTSDDDRVIFVSDVGIMRYCVKLLLAMSRT